MLQIPGPDDCFLTGLCGATRDHVGPPPGLMFLAIGMIGLGVAVLVGERRRARSQPPTSPSEDRPPTS